jgi:hypothetical protein
MMYGFAIALFVAIVTIVPMFSDWYPVWIQQSNTPKLFKDMPFLPMWLMVGLAIFATVF